MANSETVCSVTRKRISVDSCDRAVPTNRFARQCWNAWPPRKRGMKLTPVASFSQNARCIPSVVDGPLREPDSHPDAAVRHRVKKSSRRSGPPFLTDKTRIGCPIIQIFQRHTSANHLGCRDGRSAIRMRCRLVFGQSWKQTFEATVKQKNWLCVAFVNS